MVLIPLKRVWLIYVAYKGFLGFFKILSLQLWESQHVEDPNNGLQILERWLVGFASASDPPKDREGINNNAWPARTQLPVAHANLSWQT